MIGRFIVPRRGDGGYRDGIWEFCRRWWCERVPEFGIVTGASPDGPFNRSAAVNDAARNAEPWDVAIVIDADVIADPWQVRIAANTAYTTGDVVLGFTTYHGLTPRATRRVIAGVEEPSPRGRLVTKREHESSIVCVRHDTWDTIGGFDEAFVGWGQEDVAFAAAARVLAGVRRVPGDVYHLWHERTRERIKSAATYRANQERGRMYRATTDPDAMRDLVSGRPITGRSLAFRRIWSRNTWRGDETNAGPGSGTVATAGVVRFLGAIAAEYGITSIVDAGCAESFWMPDLPGYIGVDIVPEAIASARERYPDRDFRVLDIVSDDLPPTDAVILRDVLQHLPLADGLAVIDNVRRSGARIMIASTHNGGTNRDIPVGGWYPIDMTAPPFGFGLPDRAIDDGVWATGVRFPDKRIGVWTL